VARDALRVELDEDGQPVFLDLPRLPDGSPDWKRLGSAKYRTRDGRTVDERSTVPHPVTGEPIYPR